MTARLIGIGAVGVLCAACAVAALIGAVTLLDVSGVLRISNNDTTPSAALNNRFAIAQAGYTVLRLVAPLTGGFALAGIAILTLLARRRATALLG